MILTAVGVYSYNTTDPEAVAARERVRELALSEPGVLQMHGFYLDHTERTLRFDVVVSFDAEDRRAVWRAVREKAQAAYPDYQIQIAMDTDFNGLADS